MIDSYFRRPLFYDYALGSIVCLTMYILFFLHKIDLPNPVNTFSIATDLSTIGLTLAGFVLTLLTVLITFKSGAKIPNSNSYDDIPLFDLFFSTGLYFQSTSLLKNCVKSLVFVSVLGFSLKVFLNEEYIKYIYFSNILGLIIIMMTLLRSLLILTKILNLQKQR